MNNTAPFVLVQVIRGYVFNRLWISGFLLDMCGTALMLTVLSQATRLPFLLMSPSCSGQGLEFKNLSYTIFKKQKKDGVKIKKEVYLLNDISGQALHGQVTTILGPSGAGKSTFLDAIAGRIAKGSLEGFVSIDGRLVIFLTLDG
ncbi:hypothetical protein ZWY2020_024603 [Hordeum vulgare]|nr:hypothetical protein ZWY2020_024603 [Hordeum vulgare]